MKDRYNYHDPEDTTCEPMQDRWECEAERGDYLRDEMLDRAMEREFQKQNAKCAGTDASEKKL